MQFPDEPKNEAERLCALYKLDILDTLPEERFDYITAKVKKYFDVSYVLISIIDAKRQWFKSNQGLGLPETTRDISFCGHAINYQDVFYVFDALHDERFFDNPLVVGEPKIRFYAGLAVRIDGYAIGTLCLIDKQPRMLTDNDFVMLREFVALIELEIKQVKPPQD